MSNDAPFYYYTQSSFSRQPSRGNFFFGFTDGFNGFVRERAVSAINGIKEVFNKSNYHCLNSFIGKKRQLNSLHKIYGCYIDIDGEYPLTHFDILDKLYGYGIPSPTYIACTSQNHFQVVWLLREPIKAFPEKLELWDLVQKGLHEALKDLGADPRSLDCCRFLRTPGSRNFKYDYAPEVKIVWEAGEKHVLSSESELALYQALKGHGFIKQKRKAPLLPFRKGRLNDHRVKKLLAGVEEHKRDNACFTLALVFKSEEYSQTETLELLLDWCKRCDSGTHPFTEKEVRKCVWSAYKKDYHVSNKYLNYLAYGEFKPKPRKSRAKPRGERKRWHLKEAREKLLDFLRRNDGFFVGPLEALSKALKIPLSTLKVASAGLEEEGQINNHSKRGFRGESGLYLPDLEEGKAKVGSNSGQGQNGHTGDTHTSRVAKERKKQKKVKDIGLDKAISGEFLDSGGLERNLAPEKILDHTTNIQKSFENANSHSEVPIDLTEKVESLKRQGVPDSEILELVRAYMKTLEKRRSLRITVGYSWMKLQVPPQKSFD